jgi:hypothetical protein
MRRVKFTGTGGQHRTTAARTTAAPPGGRLDRTRGPLTPAGPAGPPPRRDGVIEP